MGSIYRDGLDTQQAEELIGYALDLLDAIRMWAEERMTILKSNKLEVINVTTGTIEFFKLQVSSCYNSFRMNLG